MKSFVLILLPSYFGCIFGAPPTKFDKDNKEIDNKNKSYVQNLLPSSLIESSQLQSEHNRNRNSRILNDFQFVQHSTGAQHVYLPYSINHNTTSNTQQNPEIVDVQVQSSANTNRVLLQLPSQQVPLHNTFEAPPRRHYRITLIRSRKPLSTPQLLTPEVEEKTLIYVLVKKPDEGSAQIHELQNLEHKQHAPEVYFIKYKDNNTSNNSTNLTPKNEKTAVKH
ncbi:hypothetical protein FF38_03148 [Lucilia cuprina]|uniref:DUF243 domain-containing protein n=1 Tax=Lucilia cuprina TaxID=7375 RepID=A0A0L0CN26_LUCCU|nr:hypothetical protein CVS40_11158 [Lucilia cuprina]KNC33710.1 hypothetical protein FF38_03148 [Lucilia cuprina]